MIIWTVVEVDYPNGITNLYNVNTWTFDSKESAEQHAKQIQAKYSAANIASGYRYNNVNVFRTILNEK